jgi:hypothetical protein
MYRVILCGEKKEQWVFSKDVPILIRAEYDSTGTIHNHQEVCSSNGNAKPKMEYFLHKILYFGCL